MRCTLLGLEIAPPDADAWDEDVDGAVAIAVAVAAATASGVPAGTKRAFCLPPNTPNKPDLLEAAMAADVWGQRQQLGAGLASGVAELTENLAQTRSTYETGCWEEACKLHQQAECCGNWLKSASIAVHRLALRCYR